MSGLIKNPIIVKASGEKELKEIQDAEKSLVDNSDLAVTVDHVEKRLLDHPEFIDYLNAIFHKDPLEQLYVYEHSSETAKVALRDLYDSISDDEVKEYQRRIAPLQEQLDNLQRKYNDLEKSYNDKYSKYQAKFNDVSSKIENLDRVLAEKRAELSRIEANKRSAIYKTRKEMVTDITPDMLDRFRKMKIDVDSLLNSLVSWEQISSNDPILKMNWKEMCDCIMEIMMNYAKYKRKKYSIPDHKSVDEFYRNSPQIHDLFTVFLHDGIEGESTDIDTTLKAREIAKTLVLPRYYIRINNRFIPLVLNVNINNLKYVDDSMILESGQSKK